jgi:hypothetical protein
MLAYKYSIRIALRNGKEIETSFINWNSNFYDALKNKAEDGFLEVDNFVINVEDISYIELLNTEEFYDYD